MCAELAPLRIDILTPIPGVHFQDAWARKAASTLFGLPVHFLSIDDLIVNKNATGRSSDLKHLARFPKEERQ